MSPFGRKIHNLDSAFFGKAVKKQLPLYIADGNAKWINLMKGTLA